MKKSLDLQSYPKEILEALAESIFEIDSQYKKVQKLKEMLFSNQKEVPQASTNSYSNKYKLAHKKNTMSMKNFKDIGNSMKKSNSIKSISRVLQSEPDESEVFLSRKEKEIRNKAEKAKQEEQKLFSLQNQVKLLELEVEYEEKQQKTRLNSINSQINHQLCRNILENLITHVISQKISEKSNQITSKKSEISEKFISLSKFSQEIENLRANLFKEWLESQKTSKRLEEKEAETEKTLEKVTNDAKLLNESKHSLTLKQKDDLLKQREILALNKLKALNQQKSLLEAKSQKLSSPSPNKLPNPNSIRENKLTAKENQLKDLETALAEEEAQIEAKRKKVTEKWEKMISKVDDVNKFEIKNSSCQIELEEKYRQFQSFKRGEEQKLRTQETLLMNQEINFLKKIGKLEESFEEFRQKDSLEESVEDAFARGFVERQSQRRRELDELSSEKKMINLTINTFLSEMK
jgi:hypothetical protein